MSAHELITEHLDLWTQAVTQKSTAGRGSNGKIELTGIKKLRELILELAVRGKLVEQDAEDEPVESLLDKIDQEITSLVKQGRIKKPKPVPQTADSDKFFEIPDAWQWVRLGSLALHSEAGWSPKCHDSPRENQSWAVLKVSAVTWGEFRPGENKQLPANLTPRSEYEVHPSDFLISRANTSELVARSVVVPESAPTKLMMSDKIIRFVFSKQVEPLYLNLFNNSPFARDYYLSVAGGTSSSMKNVSRAQIQTLPVPLPPLAEQHRIVQKVDELMALCDRLEQHTSDQLDAHETLVDTLLGTLTQSANATELADNWARLAEHFDMLFTTEQSINKLKQTILQLAVMGRLVEQDEEGESAPSLRQRIGKAKSKLIEAGALRKQKPSPTLEQSKAPFNVPGTWEWATFGEITFNRDAERIPLSVDDRRKRSGDFDYYGASGVIDSIDSYLFDSPLLLIGEDGANLINRSTPIAFIARGKYWVNNHAHVIDGISEDFLRYLCLYINATSLEPYVTGTAQPKMNQAKMNSIPVPLPPEEEQVRIVQKVDELMAICDHLKQRLSQASETHCQLAGAAVEGALN